MISLCCTLVQDRLTASELRLDRSSGRTRLSQQHPSSPFLLTSQPKCRQIAGVMDLPPPEAVHTWQKSWCLLWDRHELRRTQLRANFCRIMLPLLAEARPLGGPTHTARTPRINWQWTKVRMLS